MTRKRNDEELVSATYLLPKKVKAKIEKQAKSEHLSAGDILRRILRGWAVEPKNPDPDSVEQA